MKSGPSGPDRAKVGHGPLSAPNSLRHKDRTEWATSQTERHPQGGYSEVAHFSDAQTQLLKDCLVEARRAGHTRKSVIGLRKTIPWLLTYLRERGLSPQRVGPPEAQEYQSWLIAHGRADGRPYCNATVLNYLKAAAHFYAYLLRRGVVLSNPFVEIRRVRAEKRLPRNLPKEPEMEKLLEELSHFERAPDLRARMTRYRVHLIAELLYASGIRSGEAAALHPQDIDFEHGLLLVREGKGGKSRVAYLSQYALQVLRLYLDRIRPLLVAKAYWWNGTNSLFGCDWGALGPLVSRTLTPIARSLEVPSPAAHEFRHAFGYHLLRAGCNIRHIQQFLGHAHLKTTEIYTKVDREDLRDVLDGFHPRKSHP
jgi:integrase/recombinase XerD